MDVYWVEQTANDVPADNQWLSAGERQCLIRLRIPKRRTDWRLGRWTAKHAVAAHLNLPSDLHSLANIEIRAAPSGAPEVFLFDQPAPVTISLSHTAQAAMCAIARAGFRLGCDLEVIEPRSNAFVSDYFTPNEQALVERTAEHERPRLINLLWSAKESALKALHVGLRLDTNCVEVHPLDALKVEDNKDQRDPCPISLLTSGPYGWHPLQVSFADAKVFHGWWRDADQMIRSVICDPESR
jgi:4'-phosphopantetheinyl transferase